MKKIFILSILTLYFGYSYAQDGSFDTTFNINYGFNPGDVTGSVVQPDGKIIAYGSFTSFNGTAVSNIVRLNADGSLDNTFNAKIKRNSSPIDYTTTGPIIAKIHLLPDGKLLVGGAFDEVNGQVNKYITRLNSDGSIDSTFHKLEFEYPIHYGPSIKKFLVLNSGKILILGRFFKLDGYSVNSIALLDTEGNIDNSFTSPYFLHSESEQVFLYEVPVIQKGNGKILIYSNSRLHEIDETGAITQNPDFQFLNDEGSLGIKYLHLLHDGKIFLVRNAILERRNSDWSLDNSFSAVYPGTITKALPLADGKIILLGVFKQYNGIDRKYIVRLLPNGSIDFDFDPGEGPGGPEGTNEYPYGITLQEDGKFIIAGRFSTYDGYESKGLARINSEKVTGLNDFSKTLDLNIYPNPTTNFINIDFDNQKDVDVSLYSLDGKELYKTRAKTSIKIDLKDYPNGMYILRVNDERRKVVKR